MVMSFTFVDTSTGEGIDDYYWDFGDGVIVNGSTKKQVKHTYAYPGSYTVLHTASNSCGIGSESSLVVTATQEGEGQINILPLLYLGIGAVALSFVLKK